MVTTLSVEPGAVVSDRYLLESLIGKGGMARVFRARDQRTNKLVALKLITLGDDLEEIQQLRSWFQRELKALAVLDHPGILRLLDYGDTAEGDPFVVTELLDGKDLSQVVDKEGPLSEERVINVAIQVLSALDVAHRLGVAHRDLKPANLYLCRDGRVVILDFGLARAISADVSETLARGQGTKLAGTPQFLSPEQVDGVSLSLPSDLFSLGGTFFYLLTGKHAFTGQKAIEVMTSIVMNRRRPWDEYGSPGLRVAIDRLLAPKPEDRPQSAGEALKFFRVLTGEPEGGDQETQPRARVEESEKAEHTMVVAATQKTTESKKGSGKAVFLVLAALVVIALIAAAVWSRRPVSEPPPVLVEPTPVAPLVEPRPPELPPPPVEAPPEEPPAPDTHKDSKPAMGSIICVLRQWAEIVIDEKSQGKRQNAATFTLSAGKHSLEFKNDKYEPRKLQVLVKRNQETRVEVDFVKKIP